MDLNHLSDEQIQDYLDNPETGNRSGIEIHLHGCSLCRQNLELYRQMYGRLQQDTVPQLSINFSRQVMTRIKRQNISENHLVENILILLLLTGGAVGCAYLISPLLLFQSIVKPIVDVFSGIDFRVPLQMNGVLMLAAGILIFLLVEYLNTLLHPKS
jgi:hypothetical protein